MTDTTAWEWFTFTLTTPSDTAPDSLVKLLNTLTALPQIPTSTLFTGPTIEDPTKWLTVIPWASQAAHREWQADPRFPEVMGQLKGIIESRGWFETELGGDPFGALGSPCTEMLICYGIGDGYLDKGKEFLKRMGEGELKGLRATACGETLMKIAEEGKEEKNRAATMVLGWDSRDAHLTAKAVPGNAIISNLSLITEGADSLNMWHVNFVKYSA